MTVRATTVGATQYADAFPGCDGRTPGGDGVWFLVPGDGTVLTASMECQSGDQELIVFCDECENPLCVAPPATCGTSTSWCSDYGNLVLIRSPTTPGDFTLAVESSGEFCDDYRYCGHTQIDTCAGAGPIPLDPAIHGSTWGASDEGDEACGPSPRGSVWLKHTGDGTRLTASICSVPVNNSVHTLSILCNSCEVPRCLPNGLVDSECASGSNEVSWCSKPGDTYYLRVDGPLLSSGGDFDLSFTSDGQPCAPVYDCSAANDTCDTAEPLALDETIPVSTYGSSADGAPYCYGYDTWPGLWYDVVGDGTVLEASICRFLGYNPWAKVYCGTCDLPACVETNYSEYNVPFDVCEGNEVRAWRWCSEPGKSYHVHPIDAPYSDPNGWFSMKVKSTGIPCADFPDCVYDPPPPNDRCADATPISGEGTFAFENTYATPEEPFDMCHFTGTDPPTHDVWYCWTSPCDGPVTVETCGGTTVDTQLAVYDGCACDNLLMQCNNDACGYQSRVSFTAVKGQSYGIQIGTLIDLGGGSGEFRIACEPAPPPAPCAQFATAECSSRSYDDALNSTRGQFVIAENLSVEEANSFYRICWWGTDFDGVVPCRRDDADDFQIIYYADDCGRPGAVVGGPFSQSAGTLTVSGPRRTSHNINGSAPELEYSAEHESVSVIPGQYWIEITNSASGNCSWFWETAPLGDPLCYQTTNAETTTLDAAPIQADTVFLLQACFQSQFARAYDPSCYPEPFNDDCVARQGLVFDVPVDFDTTGATTDGPPVVPLIDPPNAPRNYFPFGDRPLHKDVWFDVIPECTGTLAVDICEADFDVKAALYAGLDCSPIDPPIAINDDACGPERALQSRMTAFMQAGQSYRLRVGGYRGDFGLGSVEASYAPPEVANLRVFAAYANCVGEACATESCEPPLYSNPCCAVQDFDADGDVDLNDYDFLRLRLTGP
ncbi:MAG: hypothetical protein Q7R41_15945 [Phycisphaerales bacterium]|nr:hypothetical protein [Phycisphaerales bacterium]